MIPVFGLFLVLAFAGAYITFRVEYRRRGLREVSRLVVLPAAVVRLAAALVAGVLVAKAGRGGWTAGLAAAVVAALLYRPGPVRLQLMDELLLFCGVAGFAGALLFAAVEDPRHIGFHGLNFYGALLAGTATYLYINKRHGIGPAVAADIGSPGMMLAYGIGRLGCQLAGDGDWGIVNDHVRPLWLGWLPDWAWAWRYPHNILRQGVYIQGCSGGYCTQLADPVYPTPLYEAVVCLLLFGLLWAVRGRFRRPGMLFALYAVLNGVERCCIEMIRVTPRYDLGGWRLSQAQLFALGWVVAGSVVAAAGWRKGLQAAGRRWKGLGLLLFVVLPLSGRTQTVHRDTLVTRYFDRDTGWIASDGCISIPLSDNRVVWMMGDSYIDNYDKVRRTTGCLFQVRNSALLQPRGNWDPRATKTLIGKGPRSFLKNDPREDHLLWPTGGYQQGDTVFVYANNIVNASGGLGFASGGSDFLVRLRMPGLEVVGYDSLRWFDGASFGLGFDSDEPGDYVYTWGIRSGYIESRVVVARMLRRNPGAPWSFWNGSGWDTTVANMADIATGASNGTYVARVGRKYVLVSTEFSVACDQGTRIYIATSDRITGPFTRRRVLYTIPDRVNGHSPFFYGPAIHPEYVNDQNEVLVTYDINGYHPCEPDCVNGEYDPDRYRPRGIRVPLALIESDKQ